MVLQAEGEGVATILEQLASGSSRSAAAPFTKIHVPHRVSSKRVSMSSEHGYFGQIQPFDIHFLDLTRSTFLLVTMSGYS